MLTRLLTVLLGATFASCMAIPIHARTGERVLPEEFAAWGAAWVEVPAGKGVTLRGVFVPQEGPPVLLLYGSGMGIAGAREAIGMLHDGGYSVLCCDYRGTGYSGGRWGNSRTLDDDARALYEWLLREKTGPVGVMGISIGSVAGAGLASHPTPPAAVVLDRPVDPKNVVYRWVRSELGGFASVVSHLLVRAKCDVDMKGALASAKSPTLVVLPAYDVLMPPEDAARLTGGRSASVEVVTCPGGHLNSHLVEPRVWRAAVLDHLDKHLRPGKPPLARAVQAAPTRVLSHEAVERTLTIRLSPPHPLKLTLLLCGLKGNALATIENPGAEVTLDLSRRQWRKLGREVMGVRVAPEGMPRPLGTRWVIAPAGTPGG